jgi:hypothetical protein
MEQLIHAFVEEIVMHQQMDDIRELFVQAFQMRDVRGGKGERKLFYVFMTALYRFHPNTVRRMLPLVPEYGCWRDMWELWAVLPELKADILALVRTTYMADLVKASTGQSDSMSLLAKWLPREKSATYSGLAYWIAAALYPNERSDRKKIIRYRKETSFMNAALKTVEINMCGNSWRTIAFETVPKRSMALYRKAFLNERGPHIRYPGRMDRMICRENVQAFTSTTAYSSTDTRYDPVRAVWERSMLRT